MIIEFYRELYHLKEFRKHLIELPDFSFRYWADFVEVDDDLSSLESKMRLDLEKDLNEKRIRTDHTSHNSIWSPSHYFTLFLDAEIEHRSRDSTALFDWDTNYLDARELNFLFIKFRIPKRVENPKITISGNVQFQNSDSDPGEVLKVLEANQYESRVIIYPKTPYHTRTNQELQLEKTV